jgi:replicative DNA helicase
MSDFSKFIPSVEEDEKHLLAYIIKNPSEHYIIDKNSFTVNNTKLLYETITDCYLNLEIKNFDRRVIQKYCPSIPLDYINSILEINNFDDKVIKSFTKNIKDYDVKKQIIKTVEKFLTETTARGELHYDTIRTLADNILYNSIKLDDDKTVRTNVDLVESYKETLKKRESGQSKRSYGYNVIDKMLIRPAAAGEMTTLFGIKGSGKSLICKGMENILVNKGACVISVNLEMIEESNMDRFVSMETNLSLEDLLSDNKSEEMKRVIQEALELRETKLNYAYYAEPIITLNELDAYIYKCKQKFKEAGVLPEDGYCFITIDLTEQIEELSGKAGTELKPGVNRLLQICKKHNCHVVNVLQANENIFRGGKSFSDPDSCDNFSLQPEMVEGGSVYAARSRIVMAVNRPLSLKRRFFPNREEEWDICTDLIYVNIVKQNDSPFLSKTSFAFGDSSFRLFPYKENTNK